MTRPSRDYHPEYESLRQEYLDFRYHLPGAFVEVDLASFQVVYMSRCAELLFGYDAKDVGNGLTVGALIAPEDVARTFSLVQSYVGESRASGQPYASQERSELFELNFRKQDGSTFNGEVQTRFVLDAAGIPIRMLTITRELAARA